LAAICAEQRDAPFCVSGVRNVYEMPYEIGGPDQSPTAPYETEFCSGFVPNFLSFFSLNDTHTLKLFRTRPGAS
jgi:hypothetical protein